MTETRTIKIPAVREHQGLHAMTVTLPWVCIYCGGPRGEPKEGLSYDGSRRLVVSMWDNPCGHLETYQDIRTALLHTEKAPP